MKHLITLFTLLLLPLAIFAQGRFYLGNSTYTSDILYTWQNGHVYEGNSTYTSDILFCWTGVIPVSAIILMVYTSL